jgi:hypothetical protein
MAYSGRLVLMTREGVFCPISMDWSTRSACLHILYLLHADYLFCHWKYSVHYLLCLVPCCTIQADCLYHADYYLSASVVLGDVLHSVLRLTF